ncbi:Origin recognition complex subunit Orc5 [Schizosaccharomyces pombe]
MSKRDYHTFLVLDQIDDFAEASTILFSQLAQLPIVANIPNLSIIFVLHSHPAQYLGTLSIAVIFFPQYTQAEILEICQKTPPNLDFLDRSGDSVFEDEIELSVWMQYCSFLWSVFGVQCLNDYRSFRSVLDRYWPKFIQPIVEGDIHPADYAQLHKLAKNFLVSDATVTKRLHIINPTEIKNLLDSKSINLSLVSKYLLVSAFLASYNPSRLDAQFFSSSKTSKRRGRKRKQIQDEGVLFSKIPRTAGSKGRSAVKISQLTLGPKPFEVERLIAIYYAISSPVEKVLTADVFVQIATLASLKMILSASKGVLRSLDSPRYIVNVSREYVLKIADSLSFPLDSYLAG